jgi:hypothetical protein
VVTFGGLRRINPDANYKVLVRNAALHKFGEFIVDYEVIELFPINDVVDAFFRAKPHSNKTFHSSFIVIPKRLERQ